MDKGYARIKRAWTKGDTIELYLPMPIRRVKAHDAVADDAGKIALQRGPIVFCAEGEDNGGKVLDFVLSDHARLEAEFRPDLMKGVIVLKGKMLAVNKAAAGKIVSQNERDFLAIPYYAWANRGDGEMTVWLPRR